MRTSAQQSLARMLVAIAMAFTLAVPQRCLAQGKPQKVWKVKESEFKLRITGERLVLFQGPLEVESIPLSAIAAMAHEQHREWPARGGLDTFVEDTLTSRVEQGRATYADLYSVYAGVLLALPFWLFRKSRHVIRISWANEGEKRTTGILLSKKDARDVFEELRRALGPEWKERAETIISEGSRENYSIQVEEDRVIPGPRRRPVLPPARVIDLSHLSRDELFLGRPAPDLASRRNSPEGAH